MKTSLLSIASAFVLLFSASNLATAAPVAGKTMVALHDDDKRRNDHNDRYDKDSRLSNAEKARLEALRRKNDRHDDDRRDNSRRDNDRQDYRNDRNTNYGYDKNHRVTAAEKARWEAQHRNDRH